MVTSGEFTAAMAELAGSVAVVCVRDDDDDVGMTSTTFCSISLEPPLVALAVNTKSYLDELLERRSRWAVTVLSAGQRAVASRFAALGRPSARLLLADLPHHRGPLSQGLIAEGGVAALECETVQRVPAGDHTLLLARPLAVDYLGGEADRPLVYLRRQYRGIP
jgi:flavin reductase (DIM6/NTAB) family NADH-FMN oxidoreductase RutF